MEVRVLFPLESMNAAVHHVVQQDPYFRDREAELLHSIQLSIQDLVDHFPKMSYVHRDGIYVWMLSYHLEGIDYDENMMQVEFMVDPLIGNATPTYIGKTYHKDSKP